ncbi:MAG: transcription termination/antitermination NusG family protein [Desulfovermiculus sp.]
MTLNRQDNPDQLFPADVLHTEIGARTWRIAKVKSRREKSLARFLARENIGYYLPLLMQRQAGQRKKRFSLIPVFSGYLFVKASDHERHQAMGSNHIASFIESRNQVRLVQELRQIHKALGQDTLVYPYHFIATGQKVRVVKGPLRGLEGKVIKKGSSYRLVLSISELMQSVLVQIDADQVEPVPERGRAVLGNRECPITGTK